VELLVSVRDAAEAVAALAGGAEIVDAKEPEAGALGAVRPQVLAAVRGVVPARVPLSAAGGDIATAADVERSLAAIEVPLTFVKLGFRGVDDAGMAERLLALAVQRADRLPGSPAVIAVAYADWRRAGGPPPACFPALVHRAGARGLLVDTAVKHAGTLRDFLPADELLDLGRGLKHLGLRYALGGSLDRRDVPLVRAAGADILGVRGAVCVGGRNGRVDPALVRSLAAEVGQCDRQSAIPGPPAR
jgi:uncharacterized protein (UPF0264 family)